MRLQTEAKLTGLARAVSDLKAISKYIERDRGLETADRVTHGCSRREGSWGYHVAPQILDRSFNRVFKA